MRIFLLVMFLFTGYYQAFTRSSNNGLYTENSPESPSESSENIQQVSDLSNLNDELKKISNENIILRASHAREKSFRYTTTVVALITFCILISLTVAFHRKQEQYKTLYHQQVAGRKIKTNYQNQEAIPLPEPNQNTSELQGINPIIVENILSYLKTFEQKKKFLIKDISLLTMAKECGTNTSYLSKVINHYKQNNFASYLNELRLSYAVELWKTTPRLRYLSIQGMANRVGFNTAQSFSKKFNEKYKISPTHFLKDVNQDLQQQG
jgi:AraC-like DNA-binding protein